VTLAELRDAYARKEITQPMFLDANDARVEIPEDEDWINATTVFTMDPHELLLEALDLLGIPWEWS
jgi:hypothetical protein